MLRRPVHFLLAPPRPVAPGPVGDFDPARIHSAFGIRRLLEPWAKMSALKTPPKQGYSCFDLANGTELDDFLIENAKILSLVVIHDPTSKIFETMQKYLSVTPLGHPHHVVFGYLPIGATPKAIVQSQRILSVPTTLIVHDRKVLMKTVGMRPNELSIKTKLTLRNVGLNPCSI